MNKIYIVSLPRTGTTSISKFLEDVGFKCKHVPSVYYNLINSDYERFSDTPCFDPSFISEICYKEARRHKFIYIERNIEDWLLSIEQSKLSTLYTDMIMNETLNDISYMDKRTYGNVFGYDGSYSREKFRQKFLEHKSNIETLLKNEQLFKYKIGDDTKELLNLLNVSKKYYNMGFPHENKSTIFQNI